MTTDHHDRVGADLALPQLSDAAVVQIHDFIYAFLDLFEARYGDQIHRYYDDRSQQDNMIRPVAPPIIDDPPF